ncbi:MAG: ATP-binding cassette domain-containing protein [Bacilli bacterium]|nr:ATP-binding cassette domain-containing protein [Bacilli bacterium]
MFKNFIVLQEECSDCGICCLASIIKYYKGYVPLEILRLETNTSNNGTNAYEIINCSIKYGFNALGKKVERLENISFPIIAHLKLDNDFYHFVVVYKIKNNYIYIMDPAIGMKKMLLDDFYKCFTGVIITFYPINKILKYKENKFILKKSIKYFKSNISKFILLFITSFFIILLTILINLEIEIVSNIKLVILFIFIIIINELLTFIKNNTLLNLNINFNNKTIKEFMNHIFNLPLYYLKLKQKGEIIERFNELNELSNNLFNIVFNLLFDIIICIFNLYILKIYNIKIIPLLIILTIFYILFNLIIYKKLLNLIRYSINMEETYNSNIIDYITNIESIKNLNIYDYFINNINNNVLNKNKIYKSINKKIYIVNLINNIIINVIELIILYLLVKSNNNVINSLIIYILLNFYIFNIRKIIDYYPNIILYKSIINKNNEFLSFNENKINNVNNTFNNIYIKNLSYKINNKSIFTNKNILIKNKDKIFINGPSGIGKSTLMKILNKEITNYSGSIYIDNYNLKDYNVNNLITYVSQEENLFNDTILNNILLGKKIDNSILTNIIKITRLNDISIIKEMGLNAIIVNNSCISGGERNRIILARSLIHSKNILILDEVLKEVDYELEIKIVKDIISYFKEKTIIYISHKNVKLLFKNVLTFRKE